jgi:hypothetical protein
MIIGWNVDLPRKSLICNNVPNNHCLSEPYNLPRKTKAEKNPYSNSGGVSVLHHTDKEYDAVRTYVKRVLHDKFKRGFPSDDNQMHTMLPESIACWVLHEPALHNIIGLHQSIPWSQEYEDSRYAETQVAGNNSGRYRDWCNFCSRPVNNNMFKSKLDAHVLHVSKIYSSQYAWLNNKEHKWINVYASQPIATHLLHAPTEEFSVSNLCQSVNNRFKHSVGLLPVRNPAHTVLKNDVHFYTDAESGSVLMVYSAHDDIDKNLEFMLFQV